MLLYVNEVEMVITNFNPLFKGLMTLLSYRIKSQACRFPFKNCLLLYIVFSTDDTTPYDVYQHGRPSASI